MLFPSALFGNMIPFVIAMLHKQIEENVLCADKLGQPREVSQRS